MCIRRQEVPLYLVFNMILTQLGRKGNTSRFTRKRAPHSSTPGAFRVGPWLDYDSYRNDRPAPVPWWRSWVTPRTRKITSHRLWRWAMENAGATSEAEFSLSGAQWPVTQCYAGEIEVAGSAGNTQVIYRVSQYSKRVGSGWKACEGPQPVINITDPNSVGVESA